MERLGETARTGRDVRADVGWDGGERKAKVGSEFPQLKN